MTTTTVDVSRLRPLPHPEAMSLQAAELDRTLALLRSLHDDDWNRPTDCPDWDVRAMYLHVLGACEAGASIRENVHQIRAARRHQKADGGPLEAGLSAVQVAERAAQTPDQLVERLGAVAPRTVASRSRLPGLVRRLSMKVDGPVVERWSLGYLVDTIYFRDLWMHRVDACRATSRNLELTAAHDGRIVADVVAEWARRHQRPFDLTLTGPAGNRFTAPPLGDDPSERPEVLELDAVEFCRILAGRSPGDGLLGTIVPF